SDLSASARPRRSQGAPAQSRGIRAAMSLALLHGSTGGSFLTSWSPDPLLVNLLALAAVAYALGLRAAARRGRRRPSRWRIAAYYGGLAAVTVALLGPLDTWNDEMFFIHMLQ